MKLALMQPYFFPYIGYFELIARVDRWLVFDNVQYNKHTWMNRNRVLHPTHGWQYITVPVVRAPFGSLISDIQIKDPDDAIERIIRQLDHYRRHAPYYRNVVELIRLAFKGSTRLVELNVAGLAAVCNYLSVKFDWALVSELGPLDPPGLTGRERVLMLARQLGATEYINAPGGRHLFSEKDWAEAGIRLRFNKMPKVSYKCDPYAFIENLSIIDVLMWNDPSVVRNFFRPA